MASRVFISSTRIDLVDYRAAVQGAVRQLGAIDVSMEHFGARDELPKDECLKLVRQESDLFVGIYAHRYGFVPSGDTVSITESEYRAASEVSLPRFIYIVDDEHPWRPAHIDNGTPGKRLATLKATLKRAHICGRFTTPDHLAASVAADLGRHFARLSAVRVAPGGTWNRVPMESIGGPETELPEAWMEMRGQEYQRSRDIFLVHVLEPTDKPGQEFDVYIYAQRHKSTDLSDLQQAEFFLGKYWGNEVFTVQPQNGFLGFSTSAYGPFLCLCRLTFADGYRAVISRYVDFEARRNGG